MWVIPGLFPAAYSSLSFFDRCIYLSFSFVICNRQIFSCLLLAENRSRSAKKTYAVPFCPFCAPGFIDSTADYCSLLVITDDSTRAGCNLLCSNDANIEVCVCIPDDQCYCTGFLISLVAHGPHSFFLCAQPFIFSLGLHSRPLLACFLQVLEYFAHLFLHPFTHPRQISLFIFHVYPVNDNNSLIFVCIYTIQYFACIACSA